MSLSTLDTIFPADAVEFCPHPAALDILVCGTYKLEETPRTVGVTKNGDSSAPQQRRGQCLVLQFDKVDSGSSGFHPIQSIDLPAVLDMKWCHRSSSASATLSIADSEGRITLHEWQPEQRSLKQVDEIQCASKKIMCLSLDWSSRRSNTTSLGSLVTSLSDGSLSLLCPSESTLDIKNNWQAHDFEPWITAWNYWDTNIIYSGGDDLKLKGWDIRQELSRPVFVNKRFEAGVTSIQNNPHIEHLIAVGSYDNTVRLFDTRKLLAPLFSVDVGGGAWRVKWHPDHHRKNDLLVACMHDGVKVVRIEDNRGKVSKRFDAHQSMAYGADWSYGSSYGEETIIGSCSFYDHAFHLWSG